MGRHKSEKTRAQIRLSERAASFLEKVFPDDPLPTSASKILEWACNAILSEPENCCALTKNELCILREAARTREVGCLATPEDLLPEMERLSRLKGQEIDVTKIKALSPSQLASIILFKP